MLKKLVIIPLFYPRCADQGISTFLGDTQVKLSASGIKKDTESICKLGGLRRLCLNCFHFLCDAWMNMVNNYVLWLHGCIIISIYQLILFSKGKVHSLLRFLWRINRSVLDCVTDIVYPNNLLIPLSVGLALALCLKACQTQFTHHCPVHKKRKLLLVPFTSCLTYFVFCILFMHHSGVEYLRIWRQTELVSSHTFDAFVS